MQGPTPKVTYAFVILTLLFQMCRRDSAWSMRPHWKSLPAVLQSLQFFQVVSRVMLTDTFSSRETVTASTPPSRTWPTYSSTSAATTTADSETCKDSNPRFVCQKGYKIVLRCPALAQHGLCIHPRLHHQCKLSCNVCESGSSTSAAPPTTTTATTTDYYPHY